MAHSFPMLAATQRMVRCAALALAVLIGCAGVSHAQTSSNVALATAGGVATASSTLSGHPVSSVINNERMGGNYHNGMSWVDSTPNAYPDWVQINFSGTQTIDRVVLYTMQNNYTSPVEPTDTLTFSNYGVTGFTVQTWDGSAWVTQATVTGNNLVKRTVTFAPIATDRIRVNVTSSPDGYSYITEIEAWTPWLSATITQSFAPPSITAGGTSTLTFALGNANAAALTNANFNNVLTNLSVAATSLGGSCAGVTNNPPLAMGATALNLTVPSVPAGGCTVSLQVTSSTVGTHPNTASGVTSTQTPTAGAGSNTASLSVAAIPPQPAVTQRFEPAWMPSGSTSTLRINVTSPLNVALTNVNFTGTLTGMTVASTTIGGTCAGTTNSPALTVGATALNLTIPALPANGCSVTVQVTSTTAGSNPASISGATSTESSGAGAAPAVVYLTVTTEADEFYYVHADHLGTPRAITRPSDNAVVWKWDNTEAFGNSQADGNPGGLGAFTYNLRFPGQYADVETGTSYNYFRDYDPTTGRYRQSDPVGLRAGPNTYAYVGASPIQHFDPKGLDRYPGQTCYWWDMPPSSWNAFNRNRPVVTVPWPLDGDPKPQWQRDAYGNMSQSCMYWWRPPRRCEIECMVTAKTICGVVTFGTSFVVSQVTGLSCAKVVAEKCEKSCGEKPPCTTGDDFSYGAP